AQAAHRIETRPAVHAGVEEQAPARVVDEKARDGHGPWLARLEVGDHARAVQLDVAGAERVDADHGLDAVTSAVTESGPASPSTAATRGSDARRRPRRAGRSCRCAAAACPPA